MTGDASFSVQTDDLVDRVMPALESVEQKRLEYLAKFKKRQPFMYAGIAATGVISVGIFLFTDSIFALFVMILGSSGIWYWAQEPARHYRRAYKVTLLPRIANAYGDFTYQAEAGIDLETMRRSGILPSNNRYRHEDYFAGSYKGVGMEYCEGQLAVKTRSRRGSSTRITFNGLMVMLDMHKPFNGRTVVRKDAGAFNWMQRLGPLERIRLEDIDFEKQFEVHGSDQVEARRLLTPAFMERLKGLQSTVGAHSLECAFYDSRLLILMKHQQAMKTKGLLEPGPLTASAQDRGVVEKIVGEFASICGIIDELKLAEQRRPSAPSIDTPSA